MKETVSRDASPAASDAEERSPASKRGLLISIWLSTLLLLCGVGALSYVQLQNIQARQLAGIESTLSNLTRVNEEHALRTFRGADQALRFMMARYTAEGNQLDLRAMVNQGVIDGSLFAQIGIIDAHGIFQLSNLPVTKGLDLSDREHFRVHMAADTGELFVSKPVLGRASGKWSIQLTRRINQPDGSFGGVAVVSINAGYFTNFYSDLDLPPKSVAILVGLDGVIRARQQDNKESFGNAIFQTPILQLVGEGKVNGTYTGRSGVDGVERLYAYRKIPGYPLVVITGIATDTLLAMYMPSRNALIVQASALSLLLLIMATALTFHTWRLQGELAKRQRIASELRTSEERWNLAISGSNDGIWDWNVSTGSMYVSARLLTMLGHETIASSATLQNWTSYIHPDDRHAAHQKLLLHFKGQSDLYRTELRLRCKDGSYKCILIRGRALHDKAGRAVRATGSASDITEQRFAQEQIQDRTEQLDAIFSLSPDAFISFDRALRVKYTNPAFQQLTGLTSTMVIGLAEEKFTEKINELCVSNRQFHGLGALRKLSGARSRTERELIELSLPSRRILHASLKISESASVSQILYLRDVTHETIVEDMKTEFLSTAAHELRTPMAGILGFSEVLLSHDLDEAHRQEFLNIILAQSHRMTTILDELLDLARIEARKGKDFVFETLDLQTLVQEVVAGFSLPKGRPAPTVTLPATCCRADRGKARQAILNVLSNAYKYSPDAGRVSIALAMPSAATSPSLIGISIQDQGIGMTKEQQERVFERFYRVDASGSTQGTGLGMSIVKEIMELHDGAVVIDSTPGQGTSVTLLFPTASDAGSRDPAEGAASPDSAYRRTLCGE